MVFQSILLSLVITGAQTGNPTHKAKLFLFIYCLRYASICIAYLFMMIILYKQKFLTNHLNYTLNIYIHIYYDGAFNLESNIIYLQNNTSPCSDERYMFINSCPVSTVYFGILDDPCVSYIPPPPPSPHSDTHTVTTIQKNECFVLKIVMMQKGNK